MHGRHAAPLALGAFAVLVAALRLWGALGVETPWIFIDELLHWELAESLADGDGFTVRGEHVDVGYVYPLLLAAPAAAFESFAAAYDAARVLNVVLMTLAVVPLYLWGRRLLEPPAAAVAAALGLLLPSLALSGTLMTENAFFPAFLLAAFAIGRAVEEPAAWRQALALGAIGLAVATRFQGVVLVAVYATAVPLATILAGGRARDAPWALLRHRVADVAVGVAAVVFAATKLREGAPSADWLGFYTQIVDTDYSAGTLLRWLTRSAGELALSVGVVPVVALVLLLAGRGRDAAERAFLAVAASTVAWLVLVGAVAGAWPPPGVKERYLFYAAPLLLLALVLWVERGAPRPRIPLAVGAAVTVVLVGSLPLGTLIGAAGVHANAIALLSLARVAGATSTTVTRVLILAGALAAVLLLLRPKLAVAAVAAFLAAASAAAYGPIYDRSRDVHRLAGGADREWIGVDRVTLVNLSSFVPETGRGDFFPLWVPFWTTEIWNDADFRVVSVGELEPAPIVEYTGTIDWRTGQIGGALGGATLVDSRFELRGRPAAATDYLALYDAEAPVRLAAATEGVFRDDTMGSYAAYDSWIVGKRMVVVSISSSTPAVGRVGRLTTFAGVPALAPGAREARVRRVRAFDVRGPFRVEVRSRAARSLVLFVVFPHLVEPGG